MRVSAEKKCERHIDESLVEQLTGERDELKVSVQGHGTTTSCRFQVAREAARRDSTTRR